MSELELLRKAYSAVSEPTEEHVSAARDTLWRELSSSTSSPQAWAPERRRRWLRISVAALVAIIGALAGVFVFTLPKAQALTAADIERATLRVLAPPPHAITHVVIRIGTAGSVEEWVASGRPYAIHVETGAGESELTRCGRIEYRAAHRVPSLGRIPAVVTVSTSRIRPTFFDTREDPARPYLYAAGSYVSSGQYGPLTYRGKTTFRGIPAYELVRVPFRGQGGAITYIVRRDDYTPLQIREGGSLTWTFSAYERLPRDKVTERLLHVRAHTDAFVVRGSATDFYAASECAAFNRFAAATGNGKLR